MSTLRLSCVLLFVKLFSAFVFCYVFNLLSSASVYFNVVLCFSFVKVLSASVYNYVIICSVYSYVFFCFCLL